MGFPEPAWTSRRGVASRRTCRSSFPHTFKCVDGEPLDDRWRIRAGWSGRNLREDNQSTRAICCLLAVVGLAACISSPPNPPRVQPTPSGQATAGTGIDRSVLVSGPSPFADCTSGSLLPASHVSTNAEVEPSLALNPVDQGFCTLFVTTNRADPNNPTDVRFSRGPSSWGPPPRAEWWSNQAASRALCQRTRLSGAAYR